MAMQNCTKADPTIGYIQPRTKRSCHRAPYNPIRHATSAARGITSLPIAFIKIDVKGHEPKVIRGLSGLLVEQLPAIAFEANDTSHNQHFSDLLSGLSYTKSLALDYSPAIKNLWLRVLTLTLFGVRSTLKPASILTKIRHSLVSALAPAL
jgi:hypothetical protein